MRTLTHAVDDTVTSGRDSKYFGLTIDSTTVTVVGEQLAVNVTPSTLSINEGGTGTYRVKLATEPSASTSVDIVPVSMVSPSILTFDRDNTNGQLWSTYQTVTVTAAEDANAESETTILRHQVRDATVRNGFVTVTVNDNDTRGVWLSETELEITEGSTGTYDIALNTEPTGTVTVTVSGASGDVTVSPSQVSFAPSTWSEPKSIMVRVANDDDAEKDPAVTLKHTVSGGGYDAVSPSPVTVTVEDNDTRGVRLYDPADTRVWRSRSWRSRRDRPEPTGSP